METDEKVYSVDEIRSFVAPLLEKYDMASARLFGSYSRSEATPASDIDIILTGKPGFRPLNVFGVAEELHRISGKRVDVYESSELSAGTFWDRVASEAVDLC